MTRRDDSPTSIARFAALVGTLLLWSATPVARSATRGGSREAAPQDAVAVDAPLCYVPLALGCEVTVFLGNGEGSHSDVWNWNAIDFSPLPVGTPIHAMASGKVVYVKEDTAGPTGRIEDNNEVAIELADGSVNVYLHLMRDGASVAVGDEVLAGDAIGFSGNTGKSEAPHLHVDRREQSRRGKSLPFRFVEAPSADGVLRRGDRVVSRNRLRVGPLAELLELSDGYELCAKLGVRGALAVDLARLADSEATKKERAALRNAKGRADLVELYEGERQRLLLRWHADAKAALAQVEKAIAESTAEEALQLARAALQEFDGSEVEAALRNQVAALRGRVTAPAAVATIERTITQRAAFEKAVGAALAAERSAQRAARGGKAPDWKGVAKLYRAALDKGKGRGDLAPLAARAAAAGR